MANLRMHTTARAVTSNVVDDLPETHDAIDRACRAAADEFIRRDAGNLALYAGMSQQSISRQREYVDDQVPALAKVTRLVLAGRMLGRSDGEVRDFLAPLAEAAGFDFSPRLPVSGVIGDLDPVLAATIREGAESTCAAMKLLDGATPEELATAERETAQSIAAGQRLLAEVRARRVAFDLIHGSRAAKPA